MVFFILYAIAVWIAVFLIRRRWIALITLALSLAPIGGFSHVCVLFLPFAQSEPAETWLYYVALAYAVVILCVGLVIALRPPRLPPGHCHRCRYDLSGIAGTVCPECGAAIDTSTGAGATAPLDSEHKVKPAAT